MAPVQPPYAYVRRAYGVNPVPGQRARFTDGREGVIALRRAYDAYVWVKFDGAKHASPCHPTDLTYLEQSGRNGGANPPQPPASPPVQPRTPEDGQRPATPEDGRPVTTR